MKFLIVALLFSTCSSRVRHYHYEGDGRSVGTLSYLVNQGCDFRQPTPFANKTWWFCRPHGSYAVMGRVTKYGKPTESTTSRCYTTEDCMSYSAHSFVCVNIENFVRACYIDPFEAPEDLYVGREFNRFDVLGMLAPFTTIFLGGLGLFIFWRCRSTTEDEEVLFDENEEKDKNKKKNKDKKEKKDE